MSPWLTFLLWQIFAMWSVFTDSSMNCHLVSPPASQRTLLETEDAGSVDLASLHNVQLLAMRSSSNSLFSFHLGHLILPSLQLLWMIFMETFWSSYCFKYQHCPGSMISVPYPPPSVYSSWVWVCVCVCVCVSVSVSVCTKERGSLHLTFLSLAPELLSHAPLKFSVYMTWKHLKFNMIPMSSFP